MAELSEGSEQENEENLLQGGKEMSLWDHLRDLRDTLMRSVIVILLLFGTAMAFSNQIITFLSQPLVSVLPAEASGLHFTGPMDVFIASIKVSFITAIVFGCPVWSYHFWKFLEPGLYPKERKYVLPFALISMSLFLAGASFCYFLILPMTLDFLINMGLEIGTPIITVNDYLSMLGVLIFGFGFIFQTPIVLVLLSFLDLIDATGLRKARGVVLVGILVLGAALTPPDPISQIAMAVPVYLMYEISIIIISAIGKKSKEESPA